MAKLAVETTTLEIRPISAGDETADFSCGDDDLDQFLRADAKRLNHLGTVRVYVALWEGALVGYMAIVADFVRLAGSEKKSLKMSHLDHPAVPAVKVARLAVSMEFRERHRGLGTAMLRFAYSLGTRIANQVGC